MGATAEVDAGECRAHVPWGCAHCLSATDAQLAFGVEAPASDVAAIENGTSEVITCVN